MKQRQQLEMILKSVRTKLFFVLIFDSLCSSLTISFVVCAMILTIAHATGFRLWAFALSMLCASILVPVFISVLLTVKRLPADYNLVALLERKNM